MNKKKKKNCYVIYHVYIDYFWYFKSSFSSVVKPYLCRYMFPFIIFKGCAVCNILYALSPYMFTLLIILSTIICRFGLLGYNIYTTIFISYKIHSLYPNLYTLLYLALSVYSAHTTIICTLYYIYYYMYNPLTVP